MVYVIYKYSMIAPHDILLFLKSNVLHKHVRSDFNTDL